MPNEKSGVEEHLVKKSDAEQDEMADVFNELATAGDDETDADINKRLDEKAKKDEAGEATRDLDGTSKTDDVDAQTALTDGLGDGQEPETTVPATEPEDLKVDFESRALEAEKKVEDLTAELNKEKQKTASWNGRIKKANERVRELEEQLAMVKVKTDDYDPDNATDAEKLAKFRSDFPELGDVVDIMQKRIDGKVSAKPEVDPESPVEKPVDTDPEPESDGPTDHYVATRKAHPDLDEIVQAGVLLTWINTQPDFIKPHLTQIYQSGSVDQIVKMVSEFKEKTGWKSQLTNPDEINKQKKLEAMTAADGSESAGPVDKESKVDKNDYMAGAREAGLV